MSVTSSPLDVLGPPPPAVPRAELAQRLARARALMQAQGLAGLLVTERSNFAYFSGFRSAQYEHKMRPMALVVPLRGEPAAVVYSRDLGPLRRVSGWEQVRSYIDVPFPVEMVGQLLRDAGLNERGTRIGAELGTNERLGLPVTDLRRLETELVANATFLDAAPLLRELKIRKSPLEVAYIRHACAISQVAFERTCERIRPGVTGREVAQTLTIAMLELGADLTHPGKINQAYPLDHVYRAGDALWLDYGAIYRGYNADIARRAIFGRPTDEQRRQHELIWGIAEACIEAVRPGARASDVARVCNARLRAAGYPELNGPKRVGHGIGLEPSEPPSLSLVDDTLLEDGMVVTPEPRIDLSGAERLHVEEDILVSSANPDGREWLSRGGAELRQIEG
jgi:Xaa-Pro aminopeptidase